MSPRITDPFEIGGLSVPNRLYRAPLLECAGNGPDAVDTLIRELEPAAEAGAGLLFQGATIVRGEGGCAAPGMTHVHDPEFVARLERLTDAIGDGFGWLGTIVGAMRVSLPGSKVKVGPVGYLAQERQRLERLARGA